MQREPVVKSTISY